MPYQPLLIETLKGHLLNLGNKEQTDSPFDPELLSETSNETLLANETPLQAVAEALLLLLAHQGALGDLLHLLLNGFCHILLLVLITGLLTLLLMILLFILLQLQAL